MDLAAQAGLYVHVPFCQKKCEYCSFYSFTPKSEDIRRYLEAVRRQMRQMAALPEVQGLRFATVFFGGGTPSVLPPEVLASLLADCRALYAFAAGQTEITIEVNPGTIDPAGLRQLRRAGFNRLSIGVQSLDDQELHQLGRIHTGVDALAAIESARQAGFAHCSFDLMYGLPGQTASSWGRTLDRAMDCAPQHLSMYELTVEEGSPFFLHQQQGRWTLPHEDEVLAMMAMIENRISRSPLARYEISNYAAPGRECRHNLNYWRNGLYLGLGPGAVSAIGGRRLATLADFDRYCRRLTAGESADQEVEQLEAEAAFRETVVMGLRLLAGVSISGLRRRFGLDLPAYYGPVLDRLLTQDLVRLEADCLRLSPTGLPLANLVMSQLV
ncbi:radical SAM family heme chaperone HemW [Desulfobulbus sp.]|uniref:radical SAM family heme chaperone HemW n=1 Tax=Desulfobulbus sp. TaxID=895 RepID=UPI0027B9FE6C|nr:radical SAM family heme chaperone HemW [Desulfobulbus sp.]